MKLEDVKKITDNNHLNLYQITYTKEGKKSNYFFASRRSKQDLECRKNSTDAVIGLPYFIENNKIFVVIIKEFRRAINAFVYSLPAGLIDKGEASEDAIKRELKEEIGAKTLALKRVLSASYSSVGLTDETNDCYYAKVQLGYGQELKGYENIIYEIIELDDIPKIIEEKKFCLKSALLLKNFYFEKKLMYLQGGKNE